MDLFLLTSDEPDNSRGISYGLHKRGNKLKILYNSDITFQNFRHEGLWSTRLSGAVSTPSRLKEAAEKVLKLFQDQRILKNSQYFAIEVLNVLQKWDPAMISAGAIEWVRDASKWRTRLAVADWDPRDALESRAARLPNRSNFTTDTSDTMDAFETLVRQHVGNTRGGSALLQRLSDHPQLMDLFMGRVRIAMSNPQPNGALFRRAVLQAERELEQAAGRTPDWRVSSDEFLLSLEDSSNRSPEWSSHSRGPSGDSLYSAGYGGPEFRAMRQSMAMRSEPALRLHAESSGTHSVVYTPRSRGRSDDSTPIEVTWHY